MRTLVMGDIHGAAKAITQCLERSGFDRENDRLIFIGDMCDGWPYVYEAVEVILQVKNRIDILGNHDVWFRDWLVSGFHGDPIGPWMQGGSATARSYLRQIGKEDMIEEGYHGYRTSLNPGDIPVSHKQFFNDMVLYYVDEHHRLYVHGGYTRTMLIEDMKRINPVELYWNRELWNQAMCCKGNVRLKTKDKFNEIFIGHTQTTIWTTKETKTLNGFILPAGEPITNPMYHGGVYNIDTGAGGRGKLTIMDVDTKECWQSDLVMELYPNDKGRHVNY
jgi:serine/threonine protein phosphatase 1